MMARLAKVHHFSAFAFGKIVSDRATRILLRKARRQMTMTGRPTWQILAGTVSALAAIGVGVGFAVAQDRPSLNLYGATGLIDMPSAESQPDGTLSASFSRFGPISRTTLSFQLSPRISGSFRYSGVRDWNSFCPACPGGAFETYYDRSFDLRYQILEETDRLPALAIGLQDFVGTGLLAGEYLVATKNLTPNLKVTGGLGWGRLGSYGAIGSPFGDRPPLVVGAGGKFDAGQWFRGPAAPFAGIEWKIDRDWTLKAEYSSDDYAEEAGLRRTFQRSSPFNFGLEYQRNDYFRFGAYYMYGSEVGVAAHFFLNPKQRPGIGIQDGAPDVIKPRPSRTAAPEAYDAGWVEQPGVADILIKNLNKRLTVDGIHAAGIRFTGSTATVTAENNRYDAEAQFIGRVARAMSNVMPASVETFEIIPLVNGIPASRVLIRRSVLEQSEMAANATEAVRAQTRIAEAGPLRGTGLTYDPDLYPKFNWGLSPYVLTSFFDPDQPLRADLGARLSARFEPLPGVVVSGAVTKAIVGNLSDSTRVSDSVLPRVRSESNLYDREGDPALEHLTAAVYFRPAPQLYGRVTAGYLERMFAGVSAEVLWKRVDSPFALGAEVNYARQRDYDQGFGLRDYDVITGHVSGYYDFGQGYNAQLDVGRYLAGDMGATLTLRREFATGWEVGVFATLTDVSFDDFGEGSFDKGITLKIPVTWGLGTPSKRNLSATIRPVLRDGGARLNVQDRLYETIRNYDEAGIDAQWGRFWK